MKHKRLARGLGLCGGLLMAACGGGGAIDARPSSGGAPHDDGDGFQNNYQAFEPKGLRALLHWRLDAARNDLPRPPVEPIPTTSPDLSFIHSNATAGAAMQPALTWIGHATALAQLGGINVLTDPVFSERASPLSWLGPARAQPPGLALAQLPHVELVLISHNHYDHCDMDSLRALNAQAGGAPLFVVPLGLKAWMAGIGITQVVELDWWQSHRIGTVEVVMTPAQHWSGRGLFDRMKTLWGGYAVFAPDLHLYFAGDTGYSKDFADIQARFADRQGAADGGGFDIALIPIGAYEPRWFMAEQHVNPAEAVRIHQDLRAKRSMGIHWGSFQLTDESLDVPPRALAQARKAAQVPDDDFFVLAVGQTRRLPRRTLRHSALTSPTGTAE